MGEDHVSHLPCHTRHTRSDNSKRYLRAGIFDGTRVKVRCHQCVPVVLAQEICRFAVLPRIPDGMHHHDVFPHPRRRGRPWDAESTLIVPFHLTAKAQGEAPLGVGLQIPGFLRQNEWATGKCNGHRRLQLHGIRCSGSKGHRQDGIMGKFTTAHIVIARLFCLPCCCFDTRQPTTHACSQLHSRASSAPLISSRPEAG